MADEKRREGLERVLELLRGSVEEECRSALGDEQPEELAEEIEERVRKKVDVELRAEIDEAVSRLGHDVAEEIEERLRKEKKVRKREEEFKRFGVQFRIQHMIMFLSVFILIFTGLPLKFPDLVISEHLISLFGGIRNSTVLHRVGAIGLIFVAVYHTIYTILSRMGRRDFFLLLPRPQDARDLFTQIKYFLGKSDHHAHFGRFSYIEKFDYWAVYWGCVIMIGSGALLWFQDTALLFLPKYMLDIAKEAHSDEALLATLAIVVWHFYNVHFNPERFPGSLTWWHGRVSKREMIDHHYLEYERIMAEREARAKAEAEAKALEAEKAASGGPPAGGPLGSDDGPRRDGFNPKAASGLREAQPGGDARSDGED